MLKKIAYILLVLGIVNFTACINDVDFEQAENLAINTPLEVSVLHFEEPAQTFINDLGDELEIVRDSVYIEIFSEGFVVDNLTRAEFLFEATNTINRAFQAEVEFYDDNFILQHSFIFGVSESTNNQNIVVEYTEVFEELELESLKNTTNLVLNLSLAPSNNGSQITENTTGNLKLRSMATFFIDVISP